MPDAPAKGIPLFWKFSALFVLLMAFVYLEFLLGDLAFIFKDIGSDSYVIEYPGLHNRMLSIQAGGTPGWSFHTGLGQNYYPFSFEPLASLLFKSGVTSVTLVMLLMNLVYVYLAGIFMLLLLQELRLHPYACVLGALAYAFSGYSILSSTWIVTNFAAQAFHLAFLLWALERAFARRQWHWIVLPVALIAINYPVNLYFAVLVSSGYIIARCYRHNERLSDLWPRILRLLPYTLFGVGISAFILLSTVYGMSLSPRGAGSVGVFHETVPLLSEKGALLSSLLRMFSPNLAGDAAHFRLYRNYFEAPLLYCGILTVLAAATGFPRFSNRGKVVAGAASGIMAAIYLFPPLRNLVWLHLGDYYRILNLITALMLVLISSHSLSCLFTQHDTRPRPLVIVAAIGIAALLVAAQSGTPGATTVYLPVAFIILYTIVLLLQKRCQPRIFFGTLAILLCADLALAAKSIVQDRDICDRTDLESKGYNDASKRIIAALQQHDSSFFRIEKDFYSGVSLVSSYNEAMMQNYHSSGTYGPFNNVHYTRFLELFDIIPKGVEEASRFVAGTRSSPALMKLCATKYFISTRPVSDTLRNYGFQPVQKTNTYTVWKDTSALPFGFCYDAAIDQNQFQELPKNQKAGLAFHAIVMRPEDLADCNDIPRLATSAALTSTLNDAVQKLKADTLVIQSFRDEEIHGSITLQRSKLLFFSMPYDKGWAVIDNGNAKKLRPAFGGLCALYLPPGRHTLLLQYEPPYKKLSTLISICSLLATFVLLGAQFYRGKRRRREQQYT